MEKALKISGIFTVLVEIFLSLITTKALDTTLLSYKNKTLVPMNVFFLTGLVIVLVHSFSVAFLISSEDIYSQVLNQKTNRRRIICLIIGAIYVLVVLYVMADFFSGTAAQFLFVSLLLTSGWFAIDLTAASLIKAYYSDLGRAADVEHDRLFIATSKWWMLDLILAILFFVLLWSLRKGLVKEIEAGVLMIIGLIAASIIVTASLPQNKNSNT
jgi:hypothetical protein